MLIGSGRVVASKTRLAAVATIFLFIIILLLQHRSSESILILRLPSNQGSNATEHETVGNATLLAALAPSHIKAILNPKDEQFDRLQCPAPISQRYEQLQFDRRNGGSVDERKKYFFALNLRQCVGILPRLIGSIVETVRFLGPENCVLSIVEGNSDDGTFAILEALRKDLRGLGLEYHLQTSGLDPTKGDRIDALAKLRNLALEPLVISATQYSPDAVVIFINDVAICMEDILELLHQRVFQKADMVCAMDWSDIDPAPIFYDVWIARAINGDTFWGIPPDGSWRYAANLFWNHQVSRERFEQHKPIQVFACWNGAVVFSVRPIIQKKIRFRRSKPDECFTGEPRLFCKDLWMEGFSKIAVVPSVNLAYSDQAAKKVKGLHEYVSDAVKGEDVSDESLRIAWDEKPPDQVKCMSNFEDQSWAPWNQGFEPNG